MTTTAIKPNIKTQPFRLPYKMPRGLTIQEAVLDAQRKGYILITNRNGQPFILMCDDDIEYVAPMALVQAWMERAFRDKKQFT